MERRHTVTAKDPGRGVVRVVCESCGSQHNYRGGSRRLAAREGRTAASPETSTLPLVSERERSAPRMSQDENGARNDDLELMLRRVIREESGLTPAAPAKKWRGGEVVLRPGVEGAQEKTWPIETLFQKVVMVRNRLRTLEQQVNAADIPQDLKIKLQGYVTGCYGSLTTLNVLFADEEDRFKGSGK